MTSILVIGGGAAVAVRNMQHVEDDPYLLLALVVGGIAITIFGLAFAWWITREPL